MSVSVANGARIVAVLGACVLAAGSASSRSSSNQAPSPTLAQSSPNGQGPPPPQQMEPNRALGLWRSTFGAVKIEADNSHGGLDAGSLQGVWVYQRQGQEVVGYFAGSLRGNVLQFRWQEPNDPPLTGEGFLVFDVQGRQYSGRWWSDKRDRVGDWNGWRQPVARDASAQVSQPDDGQAQPSPYRRQPYRPQYQPQPYQQPYPAPQPYAPQPYQQPYPPPQPYAPQPYAPQPYAPQPYAPQPYPPPEPYQPGQAQRRQPAPQPQPTYY